MHYAVIPGNANEGPNAETIARITLLTSGGDTANNFYRAENEAQTNAKNNGKFKTPAPSPTPS